MDVSAWGPVEWAEAIGGTATVAGAVWALAKTRFITREDHAASVETMDARVGQIETRAAAMEQSMAALATREDIADLKLRLADADGDRKAMAVTVKHLGDGIRALSAGLERIETYLRDNKL